MSVIVIVSYLCASAAFLAGSVLLVSSWRGGRTGAWLVLAMAVSGLWGLFLAYAEWRANLTAAWILVAEILRYGAWFLFLTALLRAWPAGGPMRRLRVGVHILWVVLFLYCLWGGIGSLIGRPVAFSTGVPLVGILMLAIMGLMLLEQLYRNVDQRQRWALKFLVIGLGASFAYDVFIYSFALLYGIFTASTWAARGFIDILIVPLVVVAAARNSKWSLDVAISRRVVFYSTSLLVVAFYVIATAIGGYYVHLYGGSWGRVAAITLVFIAVVLLVALVLSGQARSRLRLILQKNFFNFRHDYREVWLRLTSALAASEGALPVRAVRALAEIMDSPAGALFTHSAKGSFVLTGNVNMHAAAGLELPGDLPLFAFMRERQWIYEFGGKPPEGDARLTAPVEVLHLPHVWLLIPLVLGSELVGLVALAEARARRRLDWEDIDLLRAAGSQVAATLAQADAALRLAEARQFEGFNRLTAFMMHDLKNVAAQQSLLLQNAERHKHNPAFVDDMLATVENSVRRTERLLAQLRGETRGAPRTRVSLSEAIERALVLCASRLPRPLPSLPAKELWTQADREQLAEVIAHVLRNAQEAAGQQGKVSIGARAEGTYAVIEVKDDGNGMSEEFIRDRLFQPFYTTKASKGMGIGAYQAREYVRSLGGRVCVVSAPGLGTTFVMELPLDPLTADAGADPLQAVL